MTVVPTIVLWEPLRTTSSCFQTKTSRPKHELNHLENFCKRSAVENSLGVQYPKIPWFLIMDYLFSQWKLMKFGVSPMHSTTWLAQSRALPLPSALHMVSSFFMLNLDMGILANTADTAETSHPVNTIQLTIIMMATYPFTAGRKREDVWGLLVEIALEWQVSQWHRLS